MWNNHNAQRGHMPPRYSNLSPRMWPSPHSPFHHSQNRFEEPNLHFRPPPPPPLPRQPMNFEAHQNREFHSKVPSQLSHLPPPPPLPFLMNYPPPSLQEGLVSPPAPRHLFINPHGSDEQLPRNENDRFPDYENTYSNDINFVERWSKNIEKQRNSEKNPQIKIGEVQNMLILYSEKLKMLQHLHNQMTNLEKDLNDDDWSALCKSGEDLKAEMTPLEKILEDEVYIGKLKCSLEVRREKRKKARLSKRRKREKIRKAFLEKDAKINAWRERLMEEESNKKQMEKMKEEADAIFGEVRGKHEEASKMQKLLSALHKLREARLKKGEVHGYTSNTKENAFFAKITGELDKMVEKQKDQYALEEQTLKVMMEESPNMLFQGTMRENKEVNVPETIKSIKRMYFGDLDQSLTSEEKQLNQSFVAAEDSLEILLKRRSEWDQYLSDWESPMSSSVPIHYVIPPSSPKGEWKLYQNSTNSKH